MNLDELQKMAEQEQEVKEDQPQKIRVCMGTGCVSSFSDRVLQALTEKCKEMGLDRDVVRLEVGCLGLCSNGPLVKLDKHNTLYQHVTPEDVPTILESLQEGPRGGDICPTDLPFFTRQQKIVLENSGVINPDQIEEYIAAEGYLALLTAVSQMSTTEVIAEITHSGLRGRGGAGYPTGLKWNTVAKASSEKKYVICNGDEGDPGAFMDRSVMEDDPHRVLEGMAIAAYAVGADQGYIYVRAEYPRAIKRLKTAINRAERLGLLGKNIGGTPFSFHVEVRVGAGAFVCGEETALIASIEGHRGQPRPRPPYPAQSGLWGFPTLINNVETFANISTIIRKGAAWFAGIGTERSKGTKVFCLTGAVEHTGLIEVPMGITLREIVFDIGGGIPNGRRFKAVQTGGPSGGCIPEQYLDMPVDYDSLKGVGSIMGSGGMIVIDDSSCMVDVAKYFMEFCMSESCGKCIPCRVGTAQMYNLLHQISVGEATMEELALLEELCEMVRDTSLCGLGQSAPNPVISTLRYFREEYLAHIQERRCPAGVCPIAIKEGVLSHA
jgi:bidirectional [NiFe] hydrogenase diaphorase subunit